MSVILTSVTMVGWADVPDSDRGDFRRQHAECGIWGIIYIYICCIVKDSKGLVLLANNSINKAWRHLSCAV